MTTLPHLVHIRPSFAHGGAETRLAHIINRTSAIFRHSLVVLDGNLTALSLLQHPDAVSSTTCLNTRNPLQMIARFRKLLRRLQPDLVLTYNWGSMDAAAATRLLPRTPLIHTEDGFNADEIAGQKRRRILMRRAVLGGACSVVAPSETLVGIMRRTWRLPPQIIRHIPNGVDIHRFQPSPRAPANEIVIGTVGSLSAVKRQALLLDVFAALAKTSPVRLLIAGQGPLRAELEQNARDLGIAARVDFLGYQPDPAQVYAKLDIFAMSSATEQMPMAVLEAMACGLPIAATDVGDIRNMVSSENQPFITAAHQLEKVLRSLVDDALLRRRLGEQNRGHSVRVYSIDRMCAEYVDLYQRAIANRARRRS